MSIQGVIKNTPSTTVTKDIQSNLLTFQSFWKEDSKLTFNHMLSYYGPIISTWVVFVILTLIGLFSSCISCFPIKLMIVSVYVYGLTVILLYRKFRQYCPHERPVEDLTILAIWPTVLYLIAFMISKIVIYVLPMIGAILLLTDIASALVSCSVYAIALPYSQYLLILRACEKRVIKNMWTVYQ